MGCSIDNFGFTDNGQLISQFLCTAPRSDTIGLEADVTFDNSSANQQVYCYFVISHPDGHTSGMYANNGNPISIGLPGTYKITQSNVIQSSDSLGKYQFLSVTIMNQAKTQTICWTSTPVYGCTGLTLTEAAGTTTGGISVVAAAGIAAVAFGISAILYFATRRGK